MLKQALDNGYPTVCLGRKNKKFVHVLVLETFIGPAPAGMEACHWDDDRANNKLPNLRWGAHKQNAADAVRNGRMPRGEAHPNSRLTEDFIRQVRNQHYEGCSVRSLAKFYGLSRGYLWSVVARKFWAHVA